MKLNEILLNEFTDEMNITRKFLNAVSEDLFEFTPHEKSKKMGELVNHILPISSWVPAITQSSELDWSTATPPTILNSKADILKQFEANIGIGEKALEATNNDQLMESWIMRKADTVMFSGTKETAIRKFVLSHTVHHRAQLGLYLRLNNLKVPATYVASADEVLF
ncbi:damage-inducible protein DinB [Cellulophaga sp. HaHa_2_95]|jgi:uncharacterized damage-inducible protein DinB|uniref:DinB family protein n=1 Tax=Cellulophaga sp. HaHa_2_95 TaxID=2745558 RepID=UPI001C4F091C|nr:DinB family protein [Cellulophaga sp. HaHa_2_95]QXP54630.1 damage-inducible protein DinB [Cellulophaga sp. HaHa_2_95]